ncbi:MAG: hydroxymethylbilane synthase [Gemmatimonadota bacterium]|nr:hydroxymethylbilane synthase [Gemmatimonadota bacterium]
MTAVRLGTRGSRLALTQSEWIAGLLRERHPGLEVELVRIRTSGDSIRDVPLGPELGQAFFTKEIEDALLDGRIDLAVHSCKDLATAMPEGLRIGAIPKREDPRDVLVSGYASLGALPKGATVGTSSPRRKGFLRAARPDLDVRDQRGNVPTRLQAVDDGVVDAVVLAAAGLARLGFAARATEMIDPHVMLPAAAQGALAVQVRRQDERMEALTATLDDPATRRTVEAERACLSRLEAGCQAPVGVLATLGADGMLDVQAALVTPEGVLRAERSEGPDLSSDEVGRALAESLLQQAGLPSLRDAAWAGPAPRTPDSGT